MQRLAMVSMLVPDYDEAIAFYVGVMGFELAEDTDLGGGKRWVVVTPPATRGAAQGASLLLARASDDQRDAIGRQGGGRVWLFLHTDDFERDHRRMTAGGVTFLEEPRPEPYGIVAVFEDCYGNRWDLLELAAT
jgi:catechol 2,3-dioxygenase-like lactoylglutathione lyase family enzyme